jgi:transketolase
VRTAFIQQLILEARRNPRVFLVVGDLGYSVVEPFAQEFADRFLNTGVAEQNMTGVAAGLASEGYHVFTYSIANFPTLRCLEQIRNDVCYHGLPVAIVAVGGGMAYGNLGYSHHAVQDIAIMRTLPGIRVFAPGDPGETQECVQWQALHPGPTYLRLGKAGEPMLHSVRGIDCGPLHVRQGSTSIALVSTGGMLKTAIDAHETLKADNIQIDVYSLPWLKPIKRGFLASLEGYRKIVTLEEHVAEGGLSGVLRENLATGPTVVSLHVGEETAHYVGSQEFLREAGRLDASRVAEAIRRNLA